MAVRQRVVGGEVVEVVVVEARIILVVLVRSTPQGPLANSALPLTVFFLDPELPSTSDRFIP